MKESIRFTFIAFVIIVLFIGLITWPLIGLITIIVLILLIGIRDFYQKKHTILRNFPVLGHMRYLLEMISPELHQYVVESDTDGKPIDRNHRSYIYSRAKNQNKTHPFGTELDVNERNYKWMHHSIYPAKKLESPPRVKIGGASCTQPYEASLFNISAMSFGALSKNAIKALNLAAKEGGFFHDTGEGGISKYHMNGGDLVWEIGTGYFGCRSENGGFDPEKFQEKANWDQVKMIEIKISQGAKPGHGGVLPAAKNDEEIAEIRGVKPHTDVLSPPGHSTFQDAKGLLDFVEQLRFLSNGKPVGFKLSIGNREEFIEICKKMGETGIKPDFITIDGAEGGTGAAPIDFSNYVGMPWESALIFAIDTLKKFGLKDEIKVITATKIFTSFDVFKALCIGADICNSARGMMLALGCIQALKCNTNECPTGVATNDPRFVRGLVVSEKWQRVKNYHENILEDFLELLAASGCDSVDQLNRSMIYKKSGESWISYDESA
ncbi:FMN-binding glutamate synthase family protein [Algoriphagus sp. PAP.12]|uniref:FMN-binding glutamate synthase family protein n=1 Tax=Algoriphagus sp. PAP.12 TaxID=2996678 RepID=UPI00227BE1B0|nr:FMN-binding glutamate synthase family protein [Algoriphagus sp. PAP.12]